MEKNNNFTYNKINDNITPLDTSHKQTSMDAIQSRKETLEKMKQEALDAIQLNNEFNQQMNNEEMLKKIENITIPENYCINEFGEIERPGKSK